MTLPTMTFPDALNVPRVTCISSDVFADPELLLLRKLPMIVQFASSSRMPCVVLELIVFPITWLPSEPPVTLTPMPVFDRTWFPTALQPDADRIRPPPEFTEISLCPT